MEWVIGILVLLIVLGGLFGGGQKKQPSRAKGRPAATAPAGKPPYAQIEENGFYHPLSAEDVESMFGGIRDRLKEHRQAAKAMERLSGKFNETGKLDEDAYRKVEWSDVDVRETIQEAEALYDRLFFERESASERYYKIIDDLHEAESDIEVYRDEIKETRELIKSGDFIPEKRSKQ